MTYIKSKKKGFWLICNHVGCKEKSFLFDINDARRRGWKQGGSKDSHLCPDCVKHIKEGMI